MQGSTPTQNNLHTNTAALLNSYVMGMNTPQPYLFPQNMSSLNANLQSLASANSPYQGQMNMGYAMPNMNQNYSPMDYYETDPRESFRDKESNSTSKLPTSSFSLIGDINSVANKVQMERETKWKEAKRYSEFIRRFCAEASLSDLTKENYYDLYNMAVCLLKSIDSLDPEKIPPETRQELESRSANNQHLNSNQEVDLLSTRKSFDYYYNKGTLDTNLLSKFGGIPNNSNGPPMNSAHPYNNIGTSNTSNPLANLNLMGLGYLPQEIQVPTSGTFYSNLNLPGSGVKPSPIIPPTKVTPITTIKDKSKATISTTEDDKKKKRRRRGNYTLNKRNLQCQMCGATETPEWRRGPAGDHTLCNACGLHYAKSLKKQRKDREKDGRKHSIDLLLNTSSDHPTNPTTTNLIPPVKSDSTSSDGHETNSEKNKENSEMKSNDKHSNNVGEEKHADESDISDDGSDEEETSSPNSNVTPPNNPKDIPTNNSTNNSETITGTSNPPNEEKVIKQN